MLQVISQLIDITMRLSDSDIVHLQRFLDQIADNDDLSFEFLQIILDEYF